LATSNYEETVVSDGGGDNQIISLEQAGVKSISTDPTLSGKFINMVKVACLGFNQSAVEYRGRRIPLKSLVDIQAGLLQSC